MIAPTSLCKQCGYNPSASHLLGTSLCTREAMRFALTSRLHKPSPAGKVAPEWVTDEEKPACAVLWAISPTR